MTNGYALEEVLEEDLFSLGSFLQAIAPLMELCAFRTLIPPDYTGLHARGPSGASR